jgi:hypothetical protein
MDYVHAFPRIFFVLKVPFFIFFQKEKSTGAHVHEIYTGKKYIIYNKIETSRNLEKTPGK